VHDGFPSIDPCEVPVDQQQFAALARALTSSAYDAVVAELPHDFARLLPRGAWVDVMPAEQFVAKVAERLGTDATSARVVVEATLETLAERIAAGEVDDLLTRLDRDLHPPLKKGRAAAPEARCMSLERFVERVATREGVDDELTAREHVRAVFGTLREALGDDEFFDVTAQLPPTYDVLWVK
jgi:uncharacterized protein (DUF2267 family)